jgi:hypothetical protein
MSSDSDKSITWIVTAVMIVIAVFGWGFLAGSYVGAHPVERKIQVPTANVSDIRVGRESVITVGIAASAVFIYTAVTQLPNFFTVILWHLTDRIWLLVLLLLLEVLAVAGGWSLRQLEQQLAKPYQPRR